MSLQYFEVFQYDLRHYHHCYESVTHAYITTKLCISSYSFSKCLNIFCISWLFKPIDQTYDKIININTLKQQRFNLNGVLSFSSCGHTFFDSNSMLRLTQTTLQNPSTMSFVLVTSDYDMTQQSTLWSHCLLM